MESVRPSGTVTFLFTDIEGSTVRWDRDAAAMQQAVRRHDELMRSAIAAHDGHVFKTIGDAFCAVFWKLQDGLEAARDAQLALGSEDFSAVEGVRVRMALHVGTSDERDGDYFGPTLNRVARLLAIGHGGQVLLSGVAAQAANASLPEATLRDLGEHRLKDLSVAEHVFQLVAPGLAADFPKLRSLSVLKNNLPLQLANFVGRERDVAEIKDLVARSRLVTLFGAGGVGKTRCALQVAAELLDGFEDGVWFIDLAPLSSDTLVANVMASVFELQESPTQTMLAQLSAHLKYKHLLLVVDNCEHVIHATSKVVDAILRACPRVSILATSREGLSISGEIVHRLPSLAVPEAVKGLSAAQALTYGAVALFDTRARAANARFAVSDQNAVTIAEICRRLDGIPLAIELAAARVKVLAPAQLADKLDERFRLLTGGDRTALPRQQTMRALIDWSYDLLNEREQRLFRYFSVFSGSFTLELATSICVDGSIEEFELLDLLTSLVDKSLVHPEYLHDETRYRLLESTRQYARERLADCGEYDALVRRHAAAYVTFAEFLDQSFDATPDREWVNKAEPELDNWRSALAWAFGAGGDPSTGQRLAAVKVWQELALGEGRRYVRRALEAVDEATPQELVAQLELAASKIDSIFGHFKPALASAQRALAIFETLGEPVAIANAQLCAGRALLFLGQLSEGEAMLQAALAVFRSVHNQKTMGSALSALGAAKIMQGDIPAARELLMSAGAIYKSTGADGRLPAVLSLLAEAEFRAGDAEAALRVAGEALEVHRELKSGPNVINLLYNIAAYLTALERYDDARTHAREALQLARQEQAEADVAFTLQHLAAIGALHATDDDTSRLRAARLLGFVDARLASLDSAREYTEQLEYERMRSALHEALDAERLDKLIEEGRHWNEERAITEALAI
ncbi:MAG TPA: tetratricopeptide repeat protein [Candidatus Eremiobacteraceae bacterium]|nr:tetratricopeptide repeat protein [Candidatus Eremiobacteraceae bacterium]